MRIWIGLLLLAAVASAGDPIHLTVLHTNDLHGQLEPFPPRPARGLPAAGGFAHLATMVRTIRKQAQGKVLLLDAGDIFQGTPIGNETRGDAVLECMQALRYDVMALGNHEFDYGIENMFRLVKKAAVPVLCANLGGETGPIRPYVVLQPPRAPCRIAIIGLITPVTPQITSPAVAARFTFADPIATLRSLIKQIDADLYFVLSHCGQKIEIELAKAVPKLDLVAGGHSHTPYTRKVGRVQVVQTNGKGLSLARIDFELDPDDFAVRSVRARLLPVDPNATRADERVQALIDRYGKRLNEKLSVVVGELAKPARRRRGIRSSSAGNWMTDVIRRVGKAQVGITNKGGIRTDLAAGKITLADIYRLMPFENVVIAMDLSGAELRALVRRHAFVVHGGLEWSGMQVELAGDRIAALLIGGEPLRDDRIYRVATNSFLAWGGDGFVTFRKGRNRANTGVLLRDAMARDLGRRSPVTPPDQPRLLVRKPVR